MSTIKITAKRQATFPLELCRDLGIQPGDSLRVEKRLIRGERVWTLQPNGPSDSWFGSLRKYAKGKSHDLEKIRHRVGKRMGKERSR